MLRAFLELNVLPMFPVSLLPMFSVHTVAVIVYAGWTYILKPLVNQVNSSPLDESTVRSTTLEYDRLIVWAQDLPKTREKLSNLKEALDVGLYHIRTFDYEKSNRGGSHNKVVDRNIYISKKAIADGSLATALVIFAEFQHAEEGGNMDEQNANIEFIYLRRRIPLEERANYIRNLTHGGLPVAE